jgi:hypothetical protein
MCSFRLPARLVFVVLCLPFALLSWNAPAAAIWSSPASGFWRESANWLNGNLPSLGGVYVTNAGTKTVTIDAGTPAANLFINSLNVWAPPNATNTLWLQGLGTNTPLVVSNSTLDVRMRGDLRITDSSLIVASAFTGSGISFNIWAGSATLDSGTLLLREPPSTISPSMVTRVGRTNVAILNINGGFMQSSLMQVGQAGLPNSRSHGTVRMTGGVLKVLGELSIGTSLNCTGVVDMIGGQIVVPINPTNITRIGDQGVGLMTVANATVTVGDVSVGRHDSSEGTLVLLPGGLVSTADDFSIGRFGSATGRVFAAGGQLIVTNHPIWVGREGYGQLVVSNGLVSALNFEVASALTNTAQGTVWLGGGTTVASGRFTVGSATFSTGQVSVAGGTLLASNADQTAVLEVAGGLLTLEGGTMVADSLVVTNETAGLTFQRGTLVTSGTIISNGAPFVLGDGINPAVMELRGGTHQFADGLVISPHATLTGCGVIVGDVVNNGVNSVSCGGPGSPPFILQNPASVQVAPGGEATFSVVAASSSPPAYQWRFNGGALSGANGSTFSLAAVQPSDAGAYDVVVSNGSGSVTSRVATLTLAQAPLLTAQPVSQAVAQGSPASFHAAAVGSAPLSFQWLLNGAAISGANASNYVLASAQPVHAGDYTLVVSNPYGSATSQVATLLVLTPPTITAQPASLNVDSNSPVTFSVSAAGSPTLLYQWRLNGSPIPGATDSTYALASAGLIDVGGYTAVVRNPVGVVTSQVASLTFFGPPLILRQPASQTNARNSSMTFSVVASGTSPLRYRWRFNNNDINGATNSTYTINNLSSGNSGNYVVVVTNLLGSVTSQVAVLTVVSGTPVSITTQPISQSITQGVTATLRVVAGGSNPLSYQWRFAPPGQSEANISGATASTLILNNPQPSSAGSYRAVVSNPVSAITSEVATVTVLVPPGITEQPQSRTVQPGSNATFSVTATGAALTYQWHKNGNPIPGATGASLTLTNVQAADAGNYTVVVSNSAGSVTSSAAALRLLVPPRILTLTLTSGVAEISFTSIAGVTYALEHSDHLTGEVWTSGAAVPGNGGTLTLNDSSASVGTRFYRVRAE